MLWLYKKIHSKRCCEAQRVADSCNEVEGLMEDIRRDIFRWLLGELYCIHQEMQAGTYLQKRNIKI